MVTEVSDSAFGFSVHRSGVLNSVFCLLSSVFCVIGSLSAEIVIAPSASFLILSICRTSESIYTAFDAGVLADPAVNDKRLPGPARDWAAISTRRRKPLHHQPRTDFIRIFRVTCNSSSIAISRAIRLANCTMLLSMFTWTSTTRFSRT